MKHSLKKGIYIVAVLCVLVCAALIVAIAEVANPTSEMFDGVRPGESRDVFLAGEGLTDR